MDKKELQLELESFLKEIASRIVLTVIDFENKNNINGQSNFKMEADMEDGRFFKMTLTRKKGKKNGKTKKDS